MKINIISLSIAVNSKSRDKQKVNVKEELPIEIKMPQTLKELPSKSIDTQVKDEDLKLEMATNKNPENQNYSQIVDKIPIIKVEEIVEEIKTDTVDNVENITFDAPSPLSTVYVSIDTSRVVEDLGELDSPLKAIEDSKKTEIISNIPEIEVEDKLKEIATMSQSPSVVDKIIDDMNEQKDFQINKNKTGIFVILKFKYKEIYTRNINSLMISIYFLTMT